MNRTLHPGDAARVRDGRGKPTAHEAQRSVRGLVPNSPTPLFRGHAKGSRKSLVWSLERETFLPFEYIALKERAKMCCEY